MPLEVKACKDSIPDPGCYYYCPWVDICPGLDKKEDNMNEPTDNMNEPTGKWKIMVIRSDGVYFSGSTGLTTNAYEAEWFTDFEKMIYRIRILLAYSVPMVTQVRIIDEAFGKRE